jgi:hypothetical protein
VDLVNNKVLEYDDVFTGKAKKGLGSLLEKHFRLQYKLKATDSLQEGGLFENKIEPNDNFYLTGAGIGFTYLPYEIGPYAMGQVDIFIPLKEIRTYLKPEVSQLLQ